MNWAGALATVLGAVAATLCASSSFWSGPISARMGDLNLALPVGVLGAALLYWLFSKALRTIPANGTGAA
ncbi:hypothetical protein GCM10027187_67880 [Streptosporangium sandarakinum]